MRVLIIEDDPLFAEILETFLSINGCNTVTADSLSAGKSQLCVSTFDFILLDNHLPDGDGTDFIPFIKKLHERVPVMIITAEDNQDVMADAFDMGVDDYLVKPVSVDLLWKKMRRCRALYDKEDSLAEQSRRLGEALDRQQQEEKLARYVYEHVTSTVTTTEKYVDTYIQSSSSFNGDFFICENAPNGNKFVFLADATGHGLAAAISILPLINTLRAMSRKGLSLAHIIHECNKKLNLELPDDKFVTLVGVEISFHYKTIHIFNGGMPDILAIMQDGEVERFASGSMALGILEPEDFDPNIRTMSSDGIKSLFIYSDGLIEQPNRDGDLFGMSRLLHTIEQHKSAEPLISRTVNEFTVFNGMQELLDDLSICDVQVQNLMAAHLYETQKEIPKKRGIVTADITLEGSVISKSDVIGCIDGIMRSVDMVGDLRQRAFTVFAELISNGVDHGILKLDSALKNDFAGFAEYLELKEERMDNIAPEEKLGMKLVFDLSNNDLQFSIEDSGDGFDMDKVRAINDEALSGRGLELIDKLCSSVEVIAPGNKTVVNIKRDI